MLAIVLMRGELIEQIDRVEKLCLLAQLAPLSLALHVHVHCMCLSLWSTEHFPACPVFYVTFTLGGGKGSVEDLRPSGPVLKQLRPPH